jgi:chromosome partitioning protein
MVAPIIAVVNGKGGTGKTTTAVNVAACLVERGYRVLLVDADPQGSATWWVEHGGTDFEIDLAKESDPRRLALLRQAARSVDYMLVDTVPAHDAASLTTVVRAADWLLMPTPPSAMDIGALGETIKNVVTPTGVPYRVVLTRVDPRSLNEALGTQSQLRDLGIPAMRSFVRSYRAHELASYDGQPITRWKGAYARQAADDYRAVTDELLDLIGRTHGAQA